MYLPGDYNIVTFKMMQRWILELFIYKTYLSIEHADCTKKKKQTWSQLSCIFHSVRERENNQANKNVQ